MNEAKLIGAGTFVKKPLTVSAIAAAVRRELDKGRTQPNANPVKPEKFKVVE